MSCLLFVCCAGFPLRKAAYQTLDTLLDVAFPLLDSSVLIRELGAGLSDHDDIMIAVYQILYKLSQQHPLELSRVLDTMPQKMMVTHNTYTTRRR